MNDEYYMHLALREAQKAFDDNEVPVGAIVVLENRVISRGYNQVEKLTDATAHAEILALTAAFNFLGAKYLPDAWLFVTVEPCLMCAGAIFWSKIGRIIYGADDKKNGYRKYVYYPENTLTGVKFISPFHPKTTITTGVLKEDCSQLMKEFFREKR